MTRKSESTGEQKKEPAKAAKRERCVYRVATNLVFQIRLHHAIDLPEEADKWFTQFRGISSLL